MGSMLVRHYNLHFRYHFPHQCRPQSSRRIRNLTLTLCLTLSVMTFLETMTSASSAPPPLPSSQLLSVRATLLCDNSTYQDCVRASSIMTSEAASLASPTPSLPISLHVSVARLLDEGPGALRALLGEAGEGEKVGDVMVAVGGGEAVQTATVLAGGLGRPLLGYVHDDSWKEFHKPLMTEDYLSANADPESQGATLALLIGQYNLPDTYILIQDIFLGSSFLEGFRSKGSSQQNEIFLGKSTVWEGMTDNQIELTLEELAQKGWKIIVIHCQPHLMLRIVQHSVSMNLFGTGYGWFLSETSMTYDVEVLKRLPEGLLGLRGFYHNKTQGLMKAAAQTIRCAYTCMQECFSSDQSRSVPSFNPSSLSSSSGDVNRSLFSSSSPSLSSDSSSSFSSVGLDSERLHVPPLRERFRVSCQNAAQYFTRCVRYSPYCQPKTTNSSITPPSTSSPHTSFSSPNSTILQSGAAFHLLNLVNSGEDKRMWESVGFISARGHTDLRTVMWPGHTIFSRSSDTSKTYRVVTRPAEPFVFVEGPVTSAKDCIVDVPCLLLSNSSREHVMTVVEDFTSLDKRDDLDYQIFCCKGISLAILRRLSEDLNFQYVVYFLNDSNYGEFRNGRWSGMVGDVISGAADLIVGAFSMTSSRMQVISYTEPFYQNEFSLITGEDGRSPSIWAFLSPFSAQVWTCILLSSVVAGVATSSMEWLSPFGLNPRGRKRNKQYGLGSGLLMVWVLVTGHTINIKAPKSWPSKVIQNVWAGLAIFIMTSYTANLAAYLAGQSAVISVKSIYDSKLLQKRVSLVHSSAVEHLLKQINPDLYRLTRHEDVTSTSDGIRLVQSGQTDVYLDDYHLLEYEVSRMNRDCKVQFVGKGFGSDGYAIGLPKHSWMRMALSDKILSYTESGFIQELSKKYLTQSRCGYFLSGSAVQYGLEHTGGLFIILLSAVFVSVLLLCVEHLAYRYLVPWLRSRPECSFWKTENFAFFSQRVHRIVRSEKLYSQKQAAQEMIKIVKQRDFTRILQKNELQKRKILPQKRVMTKTEIFQEITANIVRYQRQLREPDLTQNNQQDERDIANINDDDEDEEGFVTYDVVFERRGLHAQDPSTHMVELNHAGVNNLAYNPDDDVAIIDESNHCGRSQMAGYAGEIYTEDKFDENGDVSPHKRNSRSSNSSSWSFSKRKLSVASTGREKRKSRSPSVFVIGGSLSEPNSPEPRESCDGWELPRQRRSQRGHQLHSPRHRRVSDVSPMRLPSSHPKRNNVRSRSHDYQICDYFQRNLRLKDNRVKSTLRSHALSGYQSQIPADYLDECTLEALSKEDLLILWKKSELELQSKLNDILNRNKRLAFAIDYLAKQDEDAVEV